MSDELRQGFHRDLEQLDLAVATLLGLLPDAIASATESLRSGESDLAQSVIRWRDLVEDLYGEVEITIESIIARQAPVARDLRFLLCCLRVLPEVRDAVELVGRLGAPEPAGFADELGDRLRGIIGEMDTVTREAWTATAQLWRNREAGALAAVRTRPVDPLGDLHSSLVGELAGAADLPFALEMAMRTLAYERLARHSATIDLMVLAMAGPRAEGSSPVTGADGVP